MNKLLTIFLLCCFAKAHAQVSDTTGESKAIHIRYYSVSNDSVRLSVVNADHVTIKQYKNHSTIVVYRMNADKNKMDTTIKAKK